jgi:regulator of CtrA degradation
MAEESVKLGADRQPVLFATRLAGSDVFRSMFKEGMSLVEETADYLDGDGRGESRRLTRAGALAYATESMRLTTRLMQLASWLLLQRAVNDGELTDEQARVEKSKVKLSGLATATHGVGWEALPERLKGLIARSLRLQERIRRLDGAFGPDGPRETGNPVREQIGRIAEAFNIAPK